MEEWKDVVGFEGEYQISDKGRVRSLIDKRYSKPHIRKLSKNHDGYFKIRLITNGKDVTRSVHRLVAEAFIPNVDNKETVNHIDGNKTNNNVSNLEWADRHEQLIHAYKHNLKKAKKGTTNYGAKLTERQVRDIRNEYVWQSKEHGTVALSRKYNVSNRVIGLIVNRKSYQNVL